MSFVVSKASPTPLYIQVANVMKEKIKDGLYKQGEQLPKETALANLFQVSRITVRAALDVLSKENIVVKKQGKGTYVTAPKKAVMIDSVQGFYSLLIRSGNQATLKLLNTSSCKPPKYVTDALQLSSQTTVSKIERLYIVNHQPIALTESHLFTDLQLTTEEAKERTAYGILIERMHYEPTNAKYSITTCLATKQQSELLHIYKNEPLLIVNRVSYCQNGTPLEHTKHYIVPELGELEFHLAKSKRLEDLQIVTEKA